MKHVFDCDNCGGDMVVYCHQYPPAAYYSPPMHYYKAMIESREEVLESIKRLMRDEQVATYICNDCINQ